MFSMILKYFENLRKKEEEIDIAVDDYLKPRHCLKGNSLELSIDAEKPITSFEVSEEKVKKQIEVIEINYDNRKPKSGKLF